MNVKVTAEKMKIATESNSFSDLAEKLDITLATIDSWKRRNTIPNKYLLKVSEETGVSIDWLLNEDKPIFHISGGDLNSNIQMNNGVSSGQITQNQNIKGNLNANEIRINDALLEQAKNEASKFGLDINSYLEHLIIQDLKK